MDEKTIKALLKTMDLIVERLDELKHATHDIQQILKSNLRQNPQPKKIENSGNQEKRVTKTRDQKPKQLKSVPATPQAPKEYQQIQTPVVKACPGKIVSFFEEDTDLQFDG